jgi:hypothetical protein
MSPAAGSSYSGHTQAARLSASSAGGALNVVQPRVDHRWGELTPSCRPVCRPHPERQVGQGLLAGQRGSRAGRRACRDGQQGMPSSLAATPRTMCVVYYLRDCRYGNAAVAKGALGGLDHRPAGLT